MASHHAVKGGGYSTDTYRQASAKPTMDNVDSVDLMDNSPGGELPTSSTLPTLPTVPVFSPVAVYAAHPIILFIYMIIKK